jgi:hypothetical protein
VQIRPPLGRTLGTARVALPQHVAEEITECRRVGAAHLGAEVESLESERLFAVRSGDRAGGVVAPPAIRIDQRLVGFCDLAELRRRQPIPGIDVRMVLAREPLVRTLDIRRRRAPLQTENDVEVHQVSSITAEASTGSRLNVPTRL